MNKCYTIGSIQDISNEYKTVQFTENPRVGLTHRKSAETIKKLRSAGVKCNIIVHQDFVYIASRYLMFTQFMRKQILQYLKSYNGTDIVGIVMHTDYPIRKDVLKAKDQQKAIDEHYAKGIWDRNIIAETVFNNFNIVEKSILVLAQDIIDNGITTRIYLENNTAVGPNNEASVHWLIDLFHKYPTLNKVFGIAYDTLHEYAVTGNWLSVDDIVDIDLNLCPIIVHLNTVPAEVTPGSRLDRHSFTTICDCSLNHANYYKNYANYLDSKNILWVREVKDETRIKEEQFIAE